MQGHKARRALLAALQHDVLRRANDLDARKDAFVLRLLEHAIHQETTLDQKNVAGQEGDAVCH